MDALISPRRRTLLAAAGAATLLAACGTPRTARAPHEFRGPAMGSAYTLKLAGDLDDATAERAHAAVREALAAVEARMSTWLDDSELSRFGRHPAGRPFGFSADTYAVLALAASRVSGTVFVQSCNYGEIPAIEHFHPRLKCLATLPCDWINPALYSPKPAAERTTDIVMVANWGAFKRHWELFRALAVMPPTLKVVLIGQREGGRTIETLRRLARDFGVRQELQFLESIPIEEVAMQQCKAKVSVIMTRREGCCVAAVESLFAGCALAMREDAHVGPLAYINPRTGLRLRPGRLAEDLMTLVKQAPSLDPRGWAEENVAGPVSRHKLDELLATHAKSTGRPWTRDVVQPQWRPHPAFAREEDREAMRTVYEELSRRFPQVFSDKLLTESWR